MKTFKEFLEESKINDEKYNKWEGMCIRLGADKFLLYQDTKIAITKEGKKVGTWDIRTNTGSY